MNSQINNENQVHSIGLGESGEQSTTALTNPGSVMKRVGLFLATSLFAILAAGTASATTYFSQGSVAPNTLTNWNTNRLGGGSSPSNFTAGDIFVIQGTGNGGTSPHSMTTTATWTVSGTNSEVQLENGASLSVANGTTVERLTVLSGGTASVTGGVTLTVNNGNALGADLSVAGTLSLSNGSAALAYSASATGEFLSGGKFILARNGGGGGIVPTATWDAASTVEVTGITSTVPAGLTQSLGNVTWNCSGQTVSSAIAGALAIQGDLNIQNTGTGALHLPNDTANTVGGDYIQSGGTFQLGNNSAHSLTVSCSFTLSGGTYTNLGDNSPGGTLNVAGDFSFTGGTLNGTGGTGILAVIFNGTGTQTYKSGGTIAGTVNSTVQSGSTLQMDVDATVVSGNNFTLLSGGTLGITSTAGITSSGATGNIQTTTRSYSSGANYTYNGAGGTQVTGNGLTATTPTASTVNSLTISNSAGVTLTADVTVTGVLALNSGDLSTGANTLNMDSAATSTGTPSPGTDVVGNVKRTHTFTTGTAYAFGNPFVTINFTVAGGTPTAVLVNLVKAAPSGVDVGFSTAIQRTYTITPTGAGAFTATLRLHYLDSELNGNDENSSDFDLWRYNGGTTSWQRQAKTGNDNADDWVEKSGVTAFSSWTISSTPSAPTAVNLKRFGAMGFTDGVALSWESGYEVNNLGYRLYREQNGLRTRVTPSVVAGSALKIGANQQMRAGYSYSWFDPQGTPGTAYYLEGIDLNGERQWTGPIYPASGYGESPVGKRRRALLLSEVSAASSGQTAQQSWPASMGGSMSRTMSEAMNEGGRNGSVKFRKESLGIQQQIAAGPAVKIAVRQSGWYRVSQPELVAAGLNTAAEARNLQLYVDGRQVPIRLSNDNVLGANDTLEFYGVALNTPTTDTHVYYLINGNTPGMRISNKRSKLKGTDLWTESVARNFAYTTQRQDKLIYFPSLLNGETENIFGALIMTDPVSETIAIKGFDQGSGQPQLEIALQGATKIDHAVQVQLNGANLGTINFSAVSNHTASFTLDRTQLHDGDNTLTLVATNGQQDVSLVDWVRVTYAHPYTADNNALTFSVPPGQAARVDGFSNANIRVVDITDPKAVVEVPVSVSPSGAVYAAKLQTRSASGRTLVAFIDDLVNHPVTVTANQPSNWNSGANSADLVIITHKDFRTAVEPLAQQRRSQGLNVAVVDVEDVFDEFSYGAHTPYAVRDFLAWTTTHWQTKPQYVLLVGDSSWDPRNYLDQGNNDFVPSKLVDTSLMETMSDDWVADFNDDGLAQMAVGRLPGRTSAEVGLMLSKINAYEVAQQQAGGAPRGALLVSDRGFEGQNSQTKAQLSPSVPVQTIDRAQVNDDTLMSSQLLDAINAGPMLVNYYGHGSVDVWTGAGVLNDTNAATLSNNNRLSVFVIMTCLNGYAGDAYIDSLGESLMKAQNGGAAAVWASSGFTNPQPQFAMSTSFYQQVFSASSPRLGDAIRSAKANIGDSDVRRTWILLGDPTMRLR